MPGFAATKAQSLIFRDPVTVGATKLPAGEYKITWSGTGSNVQVTLEQKGSQHPATASAPAKLVDAKHDRVSFITSTQGNVLTLETVQLKDASLQFTPAPASGQ